MVPLWKTSDNRNPLKPSDMRRGLVTQRRPITLPGAFSSIILAFPWRSQVFAISGTNCLSIRRICTTARQQPEEMESRWCEAAQTDVKQLKLMWSSSNWQCGSLAGRQLVQYGPAACGCLVLTYSQIVSPYECTTARQQAGDMESRWCE